GGSHLSSSCRAASRSKSSLKLSVKCYTEGPLVPFGDFQELAQIIRQKCSVFFSPHLVSQVLKQIPKIPEAPCDRGRYLGQETLVCLLGSTADIFYTMSRHLGDCTCVVSHDRRVVPTLHYGIP